MSYQVYVSWAKVFYEMQDLDECFEKFEELQRALNKPLYFKGEWCGTDYTMIIVEEFKYLEWF